MGMDLGLVLAALVPGVIAPIFPSIVFKGPDIVVFEVSRAKPSIVPKLSEVRFRVLDLAGKTVADSDRRGLPVFVTPTNSDPMLGIMTADLAPGRLRLVYLPAEHRFRNHLAVGSGVLFVWVSVRPANEAEVYSKLDEGGVARTLALPRASLYHRRPRSSDSL